MDAPWVDDHGPRRAGRDLPPTHHHQPRLPHDASRDWITSVTDDWTEQAELRRDALDLRAAITRKETT